MISVCPCLVYRPLIFCKRSTTARAVLQIRCPSAWFCRRFLPVLMPKIKGTNDSGNLIPVVS